MKTIKIGLVILLFLNCYALIFAQQKVYVTNKIHSNTPVIDGKLDDTVWNSVNWEGNFVQREPYERIEPSQKTRFKILYDNNNLYVAIQAFDKEVEEIERRLTRRDQFDGDWVGLGIDSYNDKLTAYAFNVTAAGVKIDQHITDETQSDLTWNPVWYVKTSIDEFGWNAEMKIPYTQLRFADKKEHKWGIQVVRWIFRKEELSAWQHVPMESSRWVSMFGELSGISGIKPKKEVEIIPYMMSNVEKFEKEENNPFATGTKYNYSFGVDGKIAITNDITLNFTVNPDFGQVEADPSEVNLTAFETFFPEKRPFFLEGSNIYDFKLTGGDGAMSQDNLFYSRRIGRSPQHCLELNELEYSNQPSFTTILGAIKISGKTKKGWSIGVLESITQKEFAEISLNGDIRKEGIEPFTNYFNACVQKDFNEGNTILGGMVTATNRKIDNSFNLLHHSGYTGGINFTTTWKNKAYYLGLKSVFSHVKGSHESITYLQESPRRYFQRSGAKHIEVDTNRSSLSGHGGTIEGGKIGEGHWRYSGMVSWRSPGVELNDMGYLREADIILQVLWLQYRIWEPFWIFRSLDLNLNQWSNYDFAGTNLLFGLSTNFNTQFKNYWSFSTGINRNLNSINRAELRGGPELKYPGSWNSWQLIKSDERKRITTELFIFNDWGDFNHSRIFNISLNLTYKPVKSLSISVAPSYFKGRRDLQYVTTINLKEDENYILSTLDSKKINVDFRIDFSITPDFSIQFWGQPFIFSGDYSCFKKITDPTATNYTDRFYIFDESEIRCNENENIYEVDENSDGSIDYSFNNPNFNFIEFRSNLVTRWEYKPGSTIYLVWSQGRTDFYSYGNLNFNRDIDHFFSIFPHNIFLLKFTYRFSF